MQIFGCVQNPNTIISHLSVEQLFWLTGVYTAKFTDGSLLTLQINCCSLVNHNLLLVECKNKHLNLSVNVYSVELDYFQFVDG